MSRRRKSPSRDPRPVPLVAAADVDRFEAEFGGLMEGWVEAALVVTEFFLSDEAEVVLGQLPEELSAALPQLVEGFGGLLEAAMLQSQELARLAAGGRLPQVVEVS